MSGLIYSSQISDHHYVKVQVFGTIVLPKVNLVNLPFLMLAGAVAVICGTNVQAAQSKKIKRAPAQIQPVFDDDEFLSGKLPGPTAASVKSLLRKIATQRANCEKMKCSKVELLRQFEASLKSYQILYDHDRLLEQENSALKTQAKIIQSARPQYAHHTCYKKDLLKTTLIDYGISENGDSIFSKKSMMAKDSRCWTNARKKLAGTVSVCEFPLAIDIQTTGGDSSSVISRFREYVFDLNGCDLLTAHIRDEEQSRQIQETRLSSQMCQEQWNKRTADALMTSQQIQLMEDTIGFCFREHLLPFKKSRGGEKNPDINFGRAITSTNDK